MNIRNLINIVALFEDAVKHEGNISKLYHVTAKSNVDSILQSGITPRSNEYVSDLRTSIKYENAVFLTDDYKQLISDMSYSMKSWSDDKIVLVVNTNGMTLYYDEAMAAEYDKEQMNSFFTDETIPPNKILSLIDPKTGKSITPAELKSNRNVLDKDEDRHDVVYATAYVGSDEHLYKFYMSDTGKSSGMPSNYPRWKVKLLDSIESEDEEDIADMQSTFDHFEVNADYVSSTEALFEEYETWWIQDVSDEEVELTEVSKQEATEFMQN